LVGVWLSNTISQLLRFLISPVLDGRIPPLWIPGLVDVGIGQTLYQYAVRAEVSKFWARLIYAVLEIFGTPSKPM